MGGLSGSADWLPPRNRSGNSGSDSDGCAPAVKYTCARIRNPKVQARINRMLRFCAIDETMQIVHAPPQQTAGPA